MNVQLVETPGAARMTTDSRRSPRRVLMTADAVGGVWRYSLDLASALCRRGVSVTLAVMGPPPSQAQRREASRERVPLVFGDFRLEWMPGGLDDFGASAAWLLTLERALWPDVVHLNGFAHAALPWRAPVLVVAHSCVRSWWRAVHGTEAPEADAGYRHAVTRGLSAARAVVSPSHAMQQALRDEYGAPLDGHVIPNGHAPARCRSRVSKQPLVFAAGRAWDPAKNIEALCAVAPLVSWPIHVAGDWHTPDGSARPLSGVVAHGRLSARAVSAWYARAAIYALPARYEPFGLSILEAARRGCALVLGDIASLREHWDGAAVFVPPDDHDALRGALQRLIDRADQRQALARLARVRSLRFGMARTSAAYLRLYQDLLA
jgi:glycogen(starch) synthase